jgi:hypothetical protein
MTTELRNAKKICASLTISNQWSVHSVILQVLTKATMMNTVFWNMAPRNQIKRKIIPVLYQLSSTP